MTSRASTYRSAKKFGNAEHAQFAKLMPERTGAVAETGMTWLQWSSKAAELMTRFAAREMASGMASTAALARCRTPATALAAQGRIGADWFMRRIAQSIALGSLAVRSQAAAITSIRRAATTNARRLSR